MAIEPIIEISNRSNRHIDVSVVVPTYNASQFLASTFRSILAQEEVNLEVIVVDDCSSDDTMAIANSFREGDPRVRLFRTASNSGGPANPRNMGIQHARGRWVAFCDSDDLWHPRKLKTQITLAEREGASLCCSDIENFLDEVGIASLSKAVPEEISVTELRYPAILLKNRIATSTVVCDVEKLRDIEKFDPARELIAVEDFDLWLRLMEKPGFKAIRLNIQLVAYRKQHGSLSSNKWRQLRKIRLVQRRAAQRMGWLWLFRPVWPVLAIYNATMGIYWRAFRGRI